ncbi:hypothetical protein LPJ71_010143, partial [Coemansia sp. S17]
SAQKKLYDEAIVLSDSSSDSDVAEVTSVFAISASLPLPTTRAAETVVVVLGDSETESPIEVSHVRRQRPILSRSMSLHSPGPAATLSRRPVERSSILPFNTEVEFSGICSPPPSQPNDTGPETPLATPNTDHGLASPDTDDKQKERLLYLHIFDNVLQTVLSG